MPVRPHSPMKPLQLFTVSLLCSVTLLADAPEAEWNVAGLSLSPRSAGVQRLQASISKGTTAYDVSVDVRLTEVSEHFVFGNKLVVLGPAGKAYAAAVFDLSARALVDWFYCKEATRVSESLIASVEWYPDHGARWPTDVVLVYDLEKSPQENRLSRISGTPPGASRFCGSGVSRQIGTSLRAFGRG
jgi:hypothetical protein